MKQYGRWLVSRNSSIPFRLVEVVGSCDLDQSSSEITSDMLNLATLIIETAQAFKGVPYINANQYKASKGKMIVNFTIIFPEEESIINFIDFLRDMMGSFEGLTNE